MSDLLKKLKGGIGVAAAIIMLPFAANAQSYDWEGFYAGATLGGAIYGVEASDLTDTFTNDSPAVETLVASFGLSGQYNWRPYDDNFVLGAEVDATFGLLNEELVAFNQAGTNGLEFINSWDSVISLRARAGMTSGRVMTFVAGGPAFANASYTLKNLDPGSTDCSDLVCAEVSETLTGVSVGAGVEYAFRDDWVGKFEFVHYAMPTVSAPTLLQQTTPSCGAAQEDECSVSFKSSATLFRLGVSYKF